MPRRILIGIIYLLDSLGSWVLAYAERIGTAVLYASRAIGIIARGQIRFVHVIEQVYQTGVGSFPIVVLTGACTGLTLALQSYNGFHRMGGEEFTGLVVVLGMTRELGPLLTGLTVAGKSGSAMAAELASMRVTEQIDALTTLNIDPFKFVIAPRIFASTIVMPILSLFCTVFGCAAAFWLCTEELGLSSEVVINTILLHAELSDLLGGLVKASVFGFIIGWIGTYMGYMTHGGARDVGISTTRSVVMCTMLIMMSNYLLSALLFTAEGT